MDDEQGCSERRRSFRVGVMGSALLWHGNQIAGRFRLVDLSIGGCQLRGEPPAEEGAEYGLVMELGAYGPMRLPAKLVRLRPLTREEHELGMMFCEHPAATEDRIHDLVMANLESERPMGGGRVLLVDPNVARRRALRESICPLGYTVIEVDSAVDAVWELENGPADFHAVLVSRWLERADGRDLVRFIGERYEGVHRVLLSDGQSFGQHSADCVLEGPFDRAHLRVQMPQALRMHSTPSLLRLRTA